MFSSFFTFSFFLLLFLSFIFFVLAWWWRKRSKTPLLNRLPQNPILSPIAAHWWESEAVFNPAAFYDHGRVHLLYRALGGDGISRIGYASSADGVHFDERLPYPVFSPDRGFGLPNKNSRYGPLSYDTHTYASGGGWGGAEDPRAVKIDGEYYMTFTAFDGWGFLRMALTSITAENLLKKYWKWDKVKFLSPPGEINKNWLLFPEKINGKYAILHSLAPEVRIAYVDNLNQFNEKKFIEGSTRHGGRPNHWDKVVRGAGTPPIKTKHGWLLFYHGFDPAHSNIAYQVGAMLLSIDNPAAVIARSEAPVLEAKEWYENDWKEGVTYASGAVVVGEDLFVYYGGGDKRIAAAKYNLEAFLEQLMSHKV